MFYYYCYYEIDRMDIERKLRQLERLRGWREGEKVAGAKLILALLSIGEEDKQIEEEESPLNSPENTVEA